MRSPDSLNDVANFHRTFGHPILGEPAVPSPERCTLRVNLLSEELKELEDAIRDNNIIEIADALCDLQYVLSGAVLEFGLGEKFKALFDEVQRSNMSKTCKTVEEAQQTVQHYKGKGVDCFFEEVEGLFLVYRSVDRKTLKSIFYSPADLKSVLT